MKLEVGDEADQYRIVRELVSRWRKRQARGGDANVSMDNEDAGGCSGGRFRVEKMIAAIEAEYRD